ncbi:hypothetical protein [Lacrimispora celerecrescens]|nr:hypothetical protein [Lacrimispora celerecrescens]
MLVKDAVSILMKFQKKEYLQQLQAGHIYMKSLQWYIDEEMNICFKISQL